MESPSTYSSFSSLTSSPPRASMSRPSTAAETRSSTSVDGEFIPRQFRSGWNLMCPNSDFIDRKTQPESLQVVSSTWNPQLENRRRVLILPCFSSLWPRMWPPTAFPQLNALLQTIHTYRPSFSIIILSFEIKGVTVLLQRQKEGWGWRGEMK